MLTGKAQSAAVCCSVRQREKGVAISGGNISCCHTHFAFAQDTSLVHHQSRNDPHLWNLRLPEHSKTTQEVEAHTDQQMREMHY